MGKKHNLVLKVFEFVLDVSKISFSVPKRLENGGTIIYLNNGEGINPIYLSTPELKLPFDANYFADDGKDESTSQTGKYSLSMSMENMEVGLMEEKKHQQL